MEQIARALAKERGMTHYFTGVTCRNGHVSERYVNSGHCLQCKNNSFSRWRVENLERHQRLCSDSARRWRIRNPDKNCAKSARRHASKLRATPSWLSDKDKKVIDGFYTVRSLMERLTGVPHHVDHVVPLQGTVVCGLHVPWNLQVIPASDNRKKYNKHS